MTTIGYLDRTEGKTIKCFFKNDTDSLFRQKKWDRIKEAFSEIKHTGNIEIYLIKGNKQRLLSVKGY